MRIINLSQPLRLLTIENSLFYGPCLNMNQKYSTVTMLNVLKFHFKISRTNFENMLIIITLVIIFQRNVF